MAVPKRRRSKSKKRMNAARWKITVPSLKPCSNCGIKIENHITCPHCGFYKGKQLIQIKEKKDKDKES